MGQHMDSMRKDKREGKFVRDPGAVICYATRISIKAKFGNRKKRLKS